MFFVEAYDIIPEPARTFILVANIIYAIGCFTLGLISIPPMKKAEVKSRKNFFIGLSMIFILLGISRIFFIYHDFYAPDYIDSIHLDIILWKIATTIMLIGFTIISYTIETHVYKKTKHIFTSIGLTLIVLFIVIQDKEIATIILYIGNAALILLPFILYIAMAINTTGVIRKRATIIVIGMAILLGAQAPGILVLLGALEMTTSLIIGPPIMVVGFTIMWYGLILSTR